MYYISGASFWKQNQVWQQRLSSYQQDLDVTNAVTSKMSTALTNLSSGLASIANQKALTRVQAQIKALTGGAQSGTTGKSVNKTA